MTNSMPFASFYHSVAVEEDAFVLVCLNNNWLLHTFMHSIWSTQRHPFLIIYTRLRNGFVNRSNRLHRLTLALAPSRSLNFSFAYLHMFFSLICVVCLAGARYFRMAILCYEIPIFLSHFSQLWLLILLDLDSWFPSFVQRRVFYSVVRHDTEFSMSIFIDQLTIAT